MWNSVLSFLVGNVLFPFLKSFIAKFIESRKDNERLLDFIAYEVALFDEVEYLGNDTKRERAFAAARKYATDIGLDVRDSFIYSAIELAVFKNRES